VAVGGADVRKLQLLAVAVHAMVCVGRKQPTSQHAQGLLGTLTAPFDSRE